MSEEQNKDNQEQQEPTPTDHSGDNSSAPTAGSGNFMGTHLGQRSAFEESLGLGSDSKSEESEAEDLPKAEAEPAASAAVETPAEQAPTQIEPEQTEQAIPPMAETSTPPAAPAEATPPLEKTPETVSQEQPKTEQEQPQEAKPSAAEQAESKTEQIYAETLKDYKEGDIIKGKVVSTGRNIMVDIDYKSEGIIEPDQITHGDKLEKGDEIDVYIIKLENKEGHPILSKRLADIEMAWRSAYEQYKKKENVTVKVVSVVRGGLVVDYNGLRGFIPASQVQTGPEEEIDNKVDQELPVRIIEVDRRRKKVVFSHRLGAQVQNKEAAAKIWEEIEAGQVKQGVVSSVKSFGVFVDIGGVEGLVHVSELSWKRINNPGSMLKIGDKVDVFVLGVDRDKKKISLGMKQLQPDPWVNVEQNYKPGQLVTGTVSRVVGFGAFVELNDGLEGLIHISELSDERVEKAEDIVKPGQKIQVRILRVDAANQRIGLSLKAAADTKKEPKKNDEKDSVTQYQQEQERNRKEVTIGDIMNQNEGQPA
jgi:4-hydroxy-3-methylbut-2-enyl diphosphate reductase